MSSMLLTAVPLATGQLLYLSIASLWPRERNKEEQEVVHKHAMEWEKLRPVDRSSSSIPIITDFRDPSIKHKKIQL